MAGKKCKDHLGQEFPTGAAMCKYWGIDRRTYDTRVRNGWTQKDALEGSKRRTPQECTDHLGQKFNSLNEMCRYWKIDRVTYYKRIQKGWTQKDALETPAKDNKCTDHLGQEFPSISAMCKHWGIDRVTYDNKIRNGWTQKDALTFRHEGVKDHLENEFATLGKMCKYWGVHRGKYYTRIHRDGKEKKETLENPSPDLILDSNLTSMSLIEKGFYKVIYLGQVDIWTYDELISYYRTINNLKITS